MDRIPAGIESKPLVCATLKSPVIAPDRDVAIVVPELFDAGRVTQKSATIERLPQTRTMAYKLWRFLPAANPLPKYKIRMPILLVVDDDRAVRHLVGQAFEGTDVTVVQAATAEDGLDLLRRQAPDTVLLDINLPEMSGLEAFRAFHALDPKLPIIFVTALDSSDVAIQAMTLGAYDFVMKPLDVAAPAQAGGTGHRGAPPDECAGVGPRINDAQ